MGQYSLGSAPERKGKMYEDKRTKKIGVLRTNAHLKTRMKADDSDAVNMSDRKLGSGVRSE